MGWTRYTFYFFVVVIHYFLVITTVFLAEPFYFLFVSLRNKLPDYFFGNVSADVFFVVSTVIFAFGCFVCPLALVLDEVGDVVVVLGYKWLGSLVL